jgi:hypothetical protein
MEKLSFFTMTERLNIWHTDSVTHCRMWKIDSRLTVYPTDSETDYVANGNICREENPTE